MVKNKSDLFSGNLAVREQARSVFKLILKSGPVTKPMLLERLALPATTLSRALDRLTADGLIVESGQADSTGGRPATLFSVKAGARQMMGVAVREEQCHLVLTDLLGQVIDRSEMNYAADPGSDEWLESLVGAAAELTVKAPGGPAGVTGVGLVLSDSLTPAIGPVLVGRIGVRLDRPAAMIDDKSGLAAMHHALQAGIEPEAILWIGDTVRLVLPESIYQYDMDPDRPSVAGLLLPDPLADDPGDLVTLETLVTCPTIGHRFAAMRDQASLDYSDFLAALQIGKKKAMRLMDATAEALAQTLINIACVTGIQQFQLTGTLMESLPEMVDLIKDKVNRMGIRSGTLIRVSCLEPEKWGLAVGAAAWMLSQLLDRPAHARDTRKGLPLERLRLLEGADDEVVGPAG